MTFFKQFVCRIHSMMRALYPAKLLFLSRLLNSEDEDENSSGKSFLDVRKMRLIDIADTLNIFVRAHIRPMLL